MAIITSYRYCAIYSSFTLLFAFVVCCISGASLSGGQRQRVGLARVAYHDDCEFVLLDDCLSAVDPHVASTIFHECIQGLMASRTRILVTHSLEFLQYASQIIFMKPIQKSNALNHNPNAPKSSSKSSSTYTLSPFRSMEMLIANEKSFAELMQSHSRQRQQQGESEESVGVCTDTVSLTFRKENNQWQNNEDEKENSVSRGEVRLPLVGPPSPTPSDFRAQNQISSPRSRMLLPSTPEQNPLPPINPSIPLSPSSPSVMSTTSPFGRASLVGKRESRSLLLPAASSTAESNDTTEVTNGPVVIPAPISPSPLNSPTSSTELVESGKISDAVLRWYLKSSGSYSLCLLVILSFMGVQASGAASDFWLATYSLNGSSSNTGYYLGIYSVFCGAAILFMFTRTLCGAMIGIRSSRSLHHQLLSMIMKKSFHIFDSTPVSQFTSRFSKDLYQIDWLLSQTFDMAFSSFISVIGTIIVVSIIVPYLCIIFVILAIIYIQIMKYYCRTSRQLQRLEAVTRTPILQHFTETIQGAMTIRFYHVQTMYWKQNLNHIELNRKFYYLSKTINFWMRFRLDLMGCMILIVSCAVGLIVNLSAASFGVLITYTLNLTLMLNWTVLFYSQLEGIGTSIERIKFYCSTNHQEAPSPNVWILDELFRSKRIEWPREGSIKFTNVVVSYNPDLPPALHDINLTIPGRARIGICGRSGCGKSTVLMTLMRVIEVSSGKIEVDGVDLSKLSLDTIRTQLCIIPQEPAIFSETIEFNLDPHCAHSEAELHEVLQAVGLHTLFIALPNESEWNRHSLLRRGSRQQQQFLSAEHGVGDTASRIRVRARLNGTVALESKMLSYLYKRFSSNIDSSLSMGQRQLLCLARAILRKPKILLLDECTANMDTQTDEMIQKVLRTQFANSTLLTVAHRLYTIRDYDYVVVLNKGKVIEFDKPADLLERPQSAYAKMCKHAEQGNNRTNCDIN